MHTPIQRLYHTAIKLLPILLIACSSKPQTTPFLSEMPPAVNMNGLMVGNGNWMALYTYAADTSSQSHCIDACAKQWPPLYANKEDTARGDFTIIQRPDGKKQWALTGKPLYYWANDIETGKAEGGQIDERWKPFLVPKL